MNIDKWFSVKVGDKLKLDGDKVEVINVTHITEANQLGGFILLKLKETEGEFYLCAKIVDKDIEARVYNEIGWIGLGTRATLLNNGNNLLFQEPKEEWVPSDLEWAESFEFDINGKPTAFNRKSTVYGEAEEKPARTGIDVSYAEVVEYEAVESTDNPELMIIELGGLDSAGESLPDGGLVVPLEGYVFDNTKIDKAWF